MNKMDRTTVTLDKKIDKTQMPAHLLERSKGVVCAKCKAGVVYAPVVSLPLPLYLTYALLEMESAIVWCDCAMGQGLQTYAQRTINSLGETSFEKGYSGEFVATHYLQDLRDALSTPPSVRFETLTAQMPSEAAERGYTPAAPVVPQIARTSVSAPLSGLADVFDEDAIPDDIDDEDIEDFVNDYLPQD